MTDQPKRSRWKRRALIAFVALLPAQYVLSVGPMSWLARRGLLPQYTHEAVGSMYVPLLWLERASPTFNWFLEWYAGLWNP